MLVKGGTWDFISKSCFCIHKGHKEHRDTWIGYLIFRHTDLLTTADDNKMVGFDKQMSITICATFFHNRYSTILGHSYLMPWQRGLRKYTRFTFSVCSFVCLSVRPSPWPTPVLILALDILISRLIHLIPRAANCFHCVSGWSLTL